RPHTKPYRTAPMEPPTPIPSSTDFNRDLETLLRSGDLCSKAWIWEQYDYTVRTNTVLGPGSDAAIIRVKEAKSSVAISLDGNGRYCYLDPREGTKLIIAECCRNLSTVGALPVATTNNLNFGNPERPDAAQLVESIEAAEACEFFAPVTEATSAFTTRRLAKQLSNSCGRHRGALTGLKVASISSIRAGPLCFSGTRRLRRCSLRRNPVRQAGTKLTLGVATGARHGPGNEFIALFGRSSYRVRRILPTISGRGLAVALAECCLPTASASVDFDSNLRPEFLLFCEAPSRILVSTSDPSRIQSIADEYGVSAMIFGATTDDGNLQIRNRRTTLIDCDIPSLRKSWASALEDLIRR
ncbi:MAG: AIR synthase related protein, partial [Bryobacteraceae bacterium]